MNTMVYKRTHTGDPNKAGVFGESGDCMGRDRRRNFDAVIGVGGIRPWHGYENIANKITWIGITPRKTEVPDLRGPLVKFEHFVLWDENGPDFETLAPKLYRYMFKPKHHVRVVMSDNLPTEMQKEIEPILNLARNLQSIPAGFENKSSTKSKCQK